jgi:hypothetical protein
MDNKPYRIQALSESAVEWEVITKVDGKDKTIGIIEEATERREGWYLYYLRPDDTRAKLKTVRKTLDEAAERIYQYWKYRNRVAEYDKTHG